MNWGRWVGRALEPYATSIYSVAFSSFTPFKFNNYSILSGGGRWAMSIPSPGKVHLGEQIINTGNFGILDARSAMSAAVATAFYRINEKPESKYYEVDGDIEGLGSHQAMPKKKVDKQKMKRLRKKLTNIREGDRINLYDFLFTKKRDYLVKCDNRKVKAEQLAGKVIVLYFVPLPYDCLYYERVATTCLMDTYNYVLSNQGIEIVLITYETPDDLEEIKPEKEFDDLFSRMPWTAIPFSDTTSRNRLRKRFGISRYDFLPSTFVIDSTGKVLQTYSCRIFDKYGGLGYPFSDEKIEYLKCKDDKAAKQLSLTTLLASPERDYVISNNGDKVPIHTLEEKVVALYFYGDGFDGDDNWITTELKMAYEELARNNKNFEVVLVYLYDTEGTCDRTSEESFWKSFQTMPWLALPFKDPNYRKLKRFFCYPTDLNGIKEAPTLVTIGPHGEFIEPWSASILTGFKAVAYSDAYPFTREKVAKLQTKKVKELKLEMLWDPNTVLRRKNGTEVQLSQLAGKRIILIFVNKKFSSEDRQVPNFLKNLTEKYVEVKGTDNEFEVVYISDSKTEFSYDDGHIGDVSWLVSHTTELLPGDYSLYCCNCWFEWSHPPLHYLPGQCHKYSSFLAFDRDGMLVRKSLIIGTPFMDGNFPFSDISMEEEAFFDLNFVNNWDDYYSGVQKNSFIKP